MSTQQEVDPQEQIARLNFSTYAQSTAFALLLTRQMIEALLFVKIGDGTAAWTASLNTLHRRGLIIIDPHYAGHKVRLSEMGKCCYRMLATCGLVPEDSGCQ